MASFVAEIVGIRAAHKVVKDKEGLVLGREKVLRITLEPRGADVDALETHLAEIMGEEVMAKITLHQGELFGENKEA